MEMVSLTEPHAASLLSNRLCNAQGKQCPGHVTDALLRIMELQAKLLDCLQRTQGKGASLTNLPLKLSVQLGVI